MNKYLTPEQFEALRPALESGSTRLFISKSIARQFLMRVSNDSIVEETGSSMFLQKALIWAGVILSILGILVALGLLVLQLGWSAAIAVPLVGIFWTVVAGFSSDLGTWVHTALAALLVAVAAFLTPGHIAVPVLLVGGSLVIVRITYSLAQVFAIRLVGRSFAAYDMLVPHITIEGEMPDT